MPARLHGDAGRLRQILTNLIGNAVKFTDQGEIGLFVSLAELRADQVVIACEVRDTGPGIPADRIDFLFEEFTQLDNSTTRRHGGTGLGLAIVKRLVAAMGGQVSVSSVVGQGSQFRFTAVLGRLPDQPPAYARRAELAGQRILVVAGGLTQRRLLAGLLEAWGCRHTELATPADALAALREAAQRGQPYAAVVLDKRPQDAELGDLPRRLRSQAPLGTLPVLLVATAGEISRHAGRLTDEGFTGWISKPLKPAQLCESLAAAITHSPVRRVEKTGSRVTWKRLTAEQRNACRILLAEDDDVSQRVAVHLLKKMDFQVDAVDDGRQALEALRTNCYDVVLLDVQMPGMDGIEVAAYIRDPSSDVRQHAVPVVALTANALASDRARCLQAGMNEHISKPLSAQALAEAIEHCLELGGAAPGPA